MSRPNKLVTWLRRNRPDSLRSDGCARKIALYEGTRAGGQLNLLAIFVSGFTVLLVLLVLGAAVGSYLVLRGRDATAPRKRVIIGRNGRVVLAGEGIRKPKNCPACWSKLEEGGPRARCELNAGHEIHEDCRQLVRGKCPVCNGKLI